MAVSIFAPQHHGPGRPPRRHHHSEAPLERDVHLTADEAKHPLSQRASDIGVELVDHLATRGIAGDVPEALKASGRELKEWVRCHLGICPDQALIRGLQSSSSWWMDKTSIGIQYSILN